MDNVPSSAILAIVAIVLACLFAAFAFTTIQSQKTAGSNAMVKVEGMNTALDESDFTQFDGALLTGSQVLAAIQQYKDAEGVVFSVQNKAGTATVYGNNAYASETTTSATTPANNTLNGTEQTPKAEVHGSLAAVTTFGQSVLVNGTSLKAMQNKNDSHYITPSGRFRGTVHRNASTNAIDWVEFTQEK